MATDADLPGRIAAERDEGHDVATLARTSATEEPLARNRPAQDLRYRIAVIAPSLPSPTRAVAATTPSRPEAERQTSAVTAHRPAGPRR